jgi:hypothetical protein
MYVCTYVDMYILECASIDYEPSLELLWAHKNLGRRILKRDLPILHMSLKKALRMNNDHIPTSNHFNTKGEKERGRVGRRF